MEPIAQQFFIFDDGFYPNNILPVVLYKKYIKLPVPSLFCQWYFRWLFRENGWTNNWKSGIYTFTHYHSNTHEVIAVCSGKTVLQVGGSNGHAIAIEKGDVLIIPAGVAHKNKGDENAVLCIGGYPDGIEFDICYGNRYERPAADLKIASLPIPDTDPLYGRSAGIVSIWQKSMINLLTQV